MKIRGKIYQIRSDFGDAFVSIRDIDEGGISVSTLGDKDIVVVVTKSDDLISLFIFDSEAGYNDWLANHNKMMYDSVTRM